MKSSLFVILAFFGLTSAKSMAATSTKLPPETPYKIIKRAANENVWQRTSYELAPGGKVVAHHHRYIELASGLNYLDSTGDWVPSKEAITSYPGGAIAQFGQYKVLFANNLNSYGAIDMQTPDGKRLRSNILGLMYHDTSTGKAVLIAQVQNSIGELISSNQVLYTNAFSGVNADVRYTYRKGSFEQDVILREQPPSPATYGMNPQTTELEVMTEFINPPTAKLISHGSDTEADEGISFGATRFGHGRAFKLGGTKNNRDRISVRKQWLNIQGRQFLLERVWLSSLKNQLQTLPLQAESEVKSPTVAMAKLIPPKIPPVRPISRGMELAMDNPRQKGYVLDYITINSGGNNFTFQGNQTYFVSDDEYLSGLTTIEGGTVIKFSTNYCGLSFDGIICKTGPYSPAVLTAMDDNTVGEAINGSTGSPVGYYASNDYALTIYGTYGTPVLHNMQFHYLDVAVDLPDTSAKCDDIQMVNCDYGFGDHSVTINNGLFVRMGALATYGGLTLTGNQLSIYSCQYIADVNQGISVNMTNSLIYGASWGTSAIDTNDVAFLTLRNGNPFQTVGGGECYLPTNSPYRDIGTTNIPASLLADLRTRTTYPPQVYSSQTISTTTPLSIQAFRDTNTPDLGYHYTPLDYAFSGVTLTTNLTVPAGVAIGWFPVPGSGGSAYGIEATNGVTVAFDGTATSPCAFTYCNTVQEGDNGLWSGYGGLGGIISYGTYENTDPSGFTELHARFTKFSHMAAEPNHFRDDGTILGVQASDCEFYGHEGGYDMEWAFTNCLFFSSDFVQSTADSQYSWETYREIYRNCTFHNGTIKCNHWESAPYWQVSIRDCAFENTIFTMPTNGLFCDYNAYLTGAPEPPVTGTTNVIVSTFNWQTNHFGDFYLPSDSQLIDAGDVTADQVGLFYFTTQTNQLFEGYSPVDIGYHYVAVDANGNPFVNQYGVADYLGDPTVNDTSGDGISDAFEASLGLNPQISDFNDTTQRANYSYTLADWIEGISGAKDATVNMDNEGNVLSISQ